MLEHGGKLIEASKKYGIPLDQWIDLSTGINPHPWPIPTVPLETWARLPEGGDGLIEAAQTYYGGQYVLPVAGSQAAIQTLPLLRNEASNIAVLSPAYAEHAHAWQDTGFDVTPFTHDQIEEVVEHHDVVVLVNPCNPTGACFDRTQCLIWHKKLASRGGWLVVDEAFMDVTSGQSLVPHTGRDGLIVLRSLGKFFGLAGARVGFVFAPPALLDAMQDELGPWTISGPSRHIAKKALEDFDWQRSTRQSLRRRKTRLSELLGKHGLEPDGVTSLFCRVQTPEAPTIHDELAKQGILTRLFVDFSLPPLPNPLPSRERGKEKTAAQSPSPLGGEGWAEGGQHKAEYLRSAKSSLRFGLPGSEQQWQRLARALQNLQAEITS